MDYSTNSGGNSARSKRSTPRYRTVGSGSEVIIDIITIITTIIIIIIIIRLIKNYLDHHLHMLVVNLQDAQSSVHWYHHHHHHYYHHHYHHH
jgi:hypothetical protein